MFTESGEPIIVPECRRCKKLGANGISWVREDQTVIFKCDSCGKKMFMGRTEVGARENKKDLDMYEKVETNRHRYSREMDAKRKEEDEELAQDQEGYKEIRKRDLLGVDRTSLFWGEYYGARLE